MDIWRKKYLPREQAKQACEDPGVGTSLKRLEKHRVAGILVCLRVIEQVKVKIREMWA